MSYFQVRTVLGAYTTNSVDQENKSVTCLFYFGTERLKWTSHFVLKSNTFALFFTAQNGSFKGAVMIN